MQGVGISTLVQHLLCNNLCGCKSYCMEVVLDVCNLRMCPAHIGDEILFIYAAFIFDSESVFVK